MNPLLTRLVAQHHAVDLHSRAERARIASGAIQHRPRSGPKTVARVRARLARLISTSAVTGRPGVRRDLDRPVTVRRATGADLILIRALAELDSRRPPGGPSLVAEIDDEIVAALAIDTGQVVANPFRWTANAVALLRLRAEQLTSSEMPSKRSLGRLQPKGAPAEG